MTKIALFVSQFLLKSSYFLLSSLLDKPLFFSIRVKELDFTKITDLIAHAFTHFVMLFLDSSQ